MTDIHRQFFELNMSLLDGAVLTAGQHDLLIHHYAGCKACQADTRLYQRLQAQAGQYIGMVSSPAVDMSKVSPARQNQNQPLSMPLALRLVGWACIAVLIILAAGLVITQGLPVARVEPAPGVIQPTGDGVKTQPDPDVPGAIRVNSILSGTPSLQQNWSPGGEYFFTELLETAIASGDRRTTSLHFISAETGEDCPASQTLFGPQDSHSTAWLDSQRVLVLEPSGKLSIFTVCQPVSEEITSLFGEPISRLALPVLVSGAAEGGPLLLEGETGYWVLTPDPLAASRVTGLTPTSDQTDTYARRPGSSQMAVIQRNTAGTGPSQLTLLDLTSGEIVEQVEVDGGQTTDPMHAEWLGPDRLLVWSMDSRGPVLVDFSAGPARQVRIIPEWLGLSITYPDQVYTAGAFYAPSMQAFHFAVQVNTPEDQSTYIYHSEDGRVEHILINQPSLLVFPDDQRMPITWYQDQTMAAESIQLFWVDAPEKSGGAIPLAGHGGAPSATLQTRLLPGSESLLVGSPHGISLIALPDGDPLAFWELDGAEEAGGISFSVSPDGKTLLAVARLNSPDQGDLLYWIAIPEGNQP
jgi:hypothetical protein